jgi:hypothetical protein
MQGTFGVWSGLLVGCMKFLFPKEFITSFGPTFTPHKSNFFFVEFDWPMSKSWNREVSQKFEDSMDRWSASPFCPLIYVRRGGLWAKHMGLKQGAIGNTHGEHIGNLLEQSKKNKNIFAPPPPPTQPNSKEKKQDTLSVCRAFPLAAWNFYSQNLLVPFSTLTNTPIINRGYLLFIQSGGCTQHQICKSLLYFLFPFHISFYSSWFWFFPWSLTFRWFQIGKNPYILNLLNFLGQFFPPRKRTP